MKVLAVDYGTKRLGVAVGSEGRVLFSKMVAVSSHQEALASLERLIEDEAVETLVFGLPRRLDGSEKREAGIVRQFAGQVAAPRHLPVVFVDERLSSEEAASVLREEGLTAKNMRGKIDKLVAELLLAQYYRDSDRRRQ